MESTNGASAGLKPWEPLELTPQHKNILMLLAAGMRAREISRIEGMPSESRISIIRNCPAGKAFLAQASSEVAQRITDDTRELITSHAREAVQTVVGLMRGADQDGVRLRASQDLLDRGGFKPVERREEVHVEVSSEDVSRLIQAMNESHEKPEELEFIEDSAGVFKKDDEILIIE